MSEPLTKPRPPRVGSRRRAREIAVKVSYAKEMRNCSLEEVMKDPLVTGGDLPPAFAVRLLSHVDEHVELLDELIRDRVHRWEFHRIAVIDRIILRLATSELVYFPDVPPKVSINEAIEIAKEFSTSQSSRFVNGILDAIFTDITNGKIVPVSNSMTDS